jgi:hypothetical protein
MILLPLGWTTEHIQCIKGGSQTATNSEMTPTTSKPLVTNTNHRVPVPDLTNLVGDQTTTIIGDMQEEGETICKNERRGRVRC